MDIHFSNSQSLHGLKKPPRRDRWSCPKESLWSAIGDFQHDGDEVCVSFKQVMDFHM